MKIYTKTGDGGMTRLLNGKTVLKTNDVVSLIGRFDTLNSYLGLLTLKYITEIQTAIFDICVVLGDSNKYSINDKKLNALIELMEKDIDAQELKLNYFVLPCNNLFLIRAMAREIEIDFLVYCEENKIRPSIVGKFLNRLSDWLFAHAVSLNKSHKKYDSKKSYLN